MSFRVILFLLFLSGCASVPPAPVNLDKEAKLFRAIDSGSVLYIYRTSLFGSAIVSSISIDDRVLGDFSHKRYYRVEVDPGIVKVGAHAQGSSYITIEAAGGEVYFIEQTINSGVLKVNTKLKVVEHDKAIPEVLRSKLVISSGKH